MIYFKRQILNKINSFLNIEKRVYDNVVLVNTMRLAKDSTDSGISFDNYCNKQVIVSLTTYGSRLNEVYLAIESLMQQTLKANKIVLWLDERTKKSHIPNLLRFQQKRGLEIRYCEDLRSYTKLIPSLKMYPNDIIITVDDDVIYQNDMIEQLVTAYMHDSSKIYFLRGHQIFFTGKRKLAAYCDWVKKGAEGCSLFNFPTGVGGVLYPPDSFDGEVFNKNVFLKICPYADDVWFKAMSLKKGVLCEKVNAGYNPNDRMVYVDTAVNSSLANINVGGNKNDEQIDLVFAKYNLLQKLLIK